MNWGNPDSFGRFVADRRPARLRVVLARVGSSARLDARESEADPRRPDAGVRLRRGGARGRRARLGVAGRPGGGARAADRVPLRGPPVHGLHRHGLSGRADQGDRRSLLHPAQHPARDPRRAGRLLAARARRDDPPAGASPPARRRHHRRGSARGPRRLGGRALFGQQRERKLRRAGLRRGPAGLPRPRLRAVDAGRRERDECLLRPECPPLPPRRGRARHRAAQVARATSASSAGGTRVSVPWSAYDGGLHTSLNALVARQPPAPIRCT